MRSASRGTAIRLGIMAGLVSACVPAGRYPLESLAASNEDIPVLLDIQSEAFIDHQPSRGSDLMVDLRLRYSGQGRPRVDFSHTEVRVDGYAWEPCRFTDAVSDEALFQFLEAGAEIRQHLACRDIARPRERIEVRFLVSGAGGRGMVILTFGPFSPDHRARVSPPVEATWTLSCSPLDGDSIHASGCFVGRLG